MPRLAVNGVELHYTEAGSGLPTLVMHGGLGSDHTYLRGQLDPLHDVLRMVYYDHRGNGRSSRPSPESLTWDSLCADAEGLRQELELGPIAVMGHSFGGHIALEYALRYPESVSHLMIISSSASFPSFEQIVRRAAEANPELAQILTSPDPTDDEGLSARVAEIGPLYFRTYDEEVSRRLYKDTVWCLSAANRNEVLVRDWDLTPRLREIAAPCLVVVGRHDFLYTVDQATTLRDGMPDAELLVCEHSGHLPYVEESDRFCAHVRDWLGRH